MWHQCLHRVTHGLVAVMVIAGSLALVGCGGDDDDNTAFSTTGAQLDAANTRTNVTSTNLATLANTDVAIDGSAFAFDTATAPTGATLRITNVRPVTVNNATPPVITGPPPNAALPQVNPPFTNVPQAGGIPPLSAIACPAALGAAGSLTNPAALVTAASPTGVADYRIIREDGAIFSGTLCIGGGTANVPGGAGAAPAQGGNICVFTNSVGSQLPGAQSIFTTCRLVVGVSPQQFVPVNTQIPGTLQLTVAQQRSGVTFTSTANPVTVSITDNGNNTGNVVVNGIATGIVVDLTDKTQ